MQSARLVGSVVSSAVLCVALACGDDDGAPEVDAGGRDAPASDAPSVDTGVGLDAGEGVDAPGGEDAGGGEGVRAFVAQGHLGRTTVSCDDGRTWVANRSLDDGARCWPESGPELDCDHHPGAGKGIAFDRGWVYATWGWGAPGGIDRSRDGSAWERVLSETSFGGIAAGGGVVVAGARDAQVSTDEGGSWAASGATGIETWNVRRAAHVDALGGRFVLIADETNVALSTDGQTWSRPSSIDASCGQGVQTRGGIAAAGDRILILGGDGVACTSDDGGDTWSARGIGTDDVMSTLVWTGAEFFAYRRGMAFRSSDGESWRSEVTTPGDLMLGAIAYDPTTGTFVGIRGGWQQWYERQAFYRSTDGITWREAGAFEGQHPIRFIEVGELAACP